LNFQFAEVKATDKFIPLYIFAGALLLFIPFLGSAHLFDWDEINFAECAREMVVTGNYSIVQIDFLPFWEKPPLFIWMQAACMNVFGVNEFAARLPNAIGGALTLAVIFILGSRISGKRFAWWWVLFYAGSLLPHFYFRSGVIDPWFNLFIFLAIYHFVVYSNQYIPKTNPPFLDWRIIYSALFLSLAILTKGPAAILIFGLCFLVFLAFKRKPIISTKHFLLYVGVTAIPAGIWFLSLVVQGKGIVILEFIEYQVRLLTTEDAGHGHNFFYHWFVLLIGCFPVSVIALQGFFKNGNLIPYEQHAVRWMRILFWVVLILFSIVKTKIIHYSSLCYFPLAYLGAHAAIQLESGSFRSKRWVTYIFVAIGCIIASALFLVPFFDDMVPWMSGRGWVKDPFAEASFRAGGGWYGWEWMIGLAMFILVAYSAYCYHKTKIRKALYTMTIGGIAVITLASLVIVPGVEQYTQNAAIEFWKSKAGKHVFVETLGYKSYAHYFYADVQPDRTADSLFGMYISGKPEVKSNTLIPAEQFREWKREWMLSGNIDRPAYFVSKNTHETVRENHPELVKIDEKNGFVFWERKP